jgi:hypothetical protein
MVLNYPYNIQTVTQIHPAIQISSTIHAANLVITTPKSNHVSPSFPRTLTSALCSRNIHISLCMYTTTGRCKPEQVCRRGRRVVSGIHILIHARLSFRRTEETLSGIALDRRRFSSRKTQASPKHSFITHNAVVFSRSGPVHSRGETKKLPGTTLFAVHPSLCSTE